ncbi:MAG: SUMF1/EgtB/PvdO family nonheme iron enzyme [Nitrospinae bacterium]|nr:SUMF1/EgtB/PvdO family nonheme iron enzyme [Nitrospinota bacterium]
MTSNNYSVRRYVKIVYRLASILFLTLHVLLLYNVYSYADICIDCHTNPRYKKEDIEKLQECLDCHGSAGHVYKKSKFEKETIVITNIADKKNLPSSNHHSELASVPGLKDMILIPKGEFIMGTDIRLKDERPEHVVYLKDFYIDKFEVTNEDYQKFIEVTGHKAPENWEDNKYPAGKGRHPVIFVDWHDSDAYCKWLGKRLPRETEWEKAARGINGFTFPWGNEWDPNKSNNPIRGSVGTMTVGSFESGKSPYGIYDMSGNVWEWVDDYYLPHPGSDYASPEFGKKYRVLKGGSWWDCSFYSCGISAPAFNRAFFDPSTKNDSFGFRCAADAR